MSKLIISYDAVKYSKQLPDILRQIGRACKEDRKHLSEYHAKDGSGKVIATVSFQHD